MVFKIRRTGFKFFPIILQGNSQNFVLKFKTATPAPNTQEGKENRNTIEPRYKPV